MTMDFSSLSDDELWIRTRRLAASERGATADLIEHIGEVDKRVLYAERGYTSMFEYCVYCLYCSEAAAYRRIRAARAIRKFESIGVLLREGRLTLEAIALLHPHLSDEDAADLIQKAAGLRTWQVQALVANRKSEPFRRDVIRYAGPVAATPQIAPPVDPLFETASTPEIVATLRHSPDDTKGNEIAPPPSPSPTSPRSIRVSFSADEDFYRLMMRARALLRHKYPDGRLEGVLRDALTALLKKKDLGFRFTEAARGARRRGGTAAVTS